MCCGYALIAGQQMAKHYDESSALRTLRAQYNFIKIVSALVMYIGGELYCAVFGSVRKQQKYCPGRAKCLRSFLHNNVLIV